MKTRHWKNNHYPIIGNDGIYDIIKVPVTAVLDSYTKLPKQSLLKNVIERSNNSDLVTIAQSIYDETELPMDLDGHVRINVLMEEYMKSGVFNKPKKAFNPSDLNEAAIKATLLQGKDEKYAATLAEARKRGYTFTSKQLAVANRKNRNLLED
jgi:hypothetical protein